MKRLATISTTAALAAGLAVALTACGGEGGATAVGEVPAGTSPSSTTTQPASTGAAETSTQETLAAADISYRVWLMRGEALAPVRRTHAATQAVGTAAMESLLAGPTDAEASEGTSTAIPDGTRLLGLRVANGTATVDLSSEFESGGGTLSMTARLGQVACTLGQFSTVRGVKFELDGKPVDVFSGEGIVLDKPVRCADYEELLPAIDVESPTPGSRIESGTVVKGSANVFEANVGYELVAGGAELAKGFTTATCGTGCRGTYSFRLTFQVDKPTDATLVVHDDDAAGTGHPPHSVRIPVTLLPD